MDKIVEEAIRKIVKQEFQNYFGGEPQAEQSGQQLQTRRQRRNLKNKGRGEVRNPRLDRRLKGNRGVSASSEE